jgi:hypothetical protein
MTGKSELTSSLCQRLSEALRVEAQLLRTAAVPDASYAALEAALSAPHAPAGLPRLAPPTLGEYLADPGSIDRTLQTYPGGADGRRLMRGFLDALEAVAAEAGLDVPPAVARIRAELATTVES